MKKKLVVFLKKRWWWLVILGAAILLIQARAQKTTTVELAAIKKQTITRTITASGRLTFSDESKIYAPLSGQIDSVVVTEGSAVKRGEVLLTYQADSLKVAVDQAYAAYQAAIKADQTLRHTTLTDIDIQALQSSVDQTRAARDAANFTYEQTNNETNKAALNAAITAHEVALSKYYAALKTNPNSVDLTAGSSAVAAAQAAWQEASRSYNQRVVVAPMSGVVSLAHDATGGLVPIPNKVTAQGQYLFAIMTPASLIFQAEVDENDIATLKLGQDVNIELDAYAGSVFVGQVNRIAGQTSLNSSGSSIYEVSVVISEPDQSFRSGLSGQASFVLQTVKDVLAVPVRAITIKNDKDNVYVYSAGKVKLTEVELGVQSATEAQVVKGLSVGDQVVVSSNLRELTDGESVTSQ